MRRYSCQAKLKEKKRHGRGKLARKSVKVAYKIVMCVLLLSTIGLLSACSEGSGWGTGFQGVPANSGGQTGDSPPTMDGFTRARPAAE
jgi:hypothetical protein